jgi:hypothetical protein
VAVRFVPFPTTSTLRWAVIAACGNQISPLVLNRHSARNGRLRTVEVELFKRAACPSRQRAWVWPPVLVHSLAGGGTEQHALGAAVADERKQFSPHPAILGGELVAIDRRPLSRGCAGFWRCRRRPAAGRRPTAWGSRGEAEHSPCGVLQRLRGLHLSH